MNWFTPLRRAALVLGIAAVPAAGQSLDGHAYITLGDGSSQLLRGTEVALVCATPSALALTDSSVVAMERAGTASEQGISQAMDASDGSPTGLARVSGMVHFSKTFLPRLAEAFWQQLMSGAVATTRTTFDGAYTFSDVEPGEYWVVARYKTNFNDAVWREPVSVAADEGATVDLSNFNMIDLREALALDAVDDRAEWVESMVIRYFSNDRLAFLQGQQVVETDARQMDVGPTLRRQIDCTQ